MNGIECIPGELDLRRRTPRRRDMPKRIFYVASHPSSSMGGLNMSDALRMDPPPDVRLLELTTDHRWSVLATDLRDRS